MNDDKKREIESDKARTAVALSATELVDRFGSANAEFIKGYNGVDYETGQRFAKGLADIAKHKVNADPLEAAKNLKQQSGYSAEVAATSRDNARAIINKSGVRTVRSDDLAAYGRNHNVVDRVQILDGKIIDASQAQMKFVGKRNELFNKICGEERSGKGDLSRYRGVKLELPSEQFEGAESFCRTRAQRLRKRADFLEKPNPKRAARYRQEAIQLDGTDPARAARLRAEADAFEVGKIDVAEKMRKEAANYDQLADNVRDSGLTSDQALFYRNHPKFATAIDIVRTSHEAGLQGAKFGAGIGGAISILTNAFAIAQNKKQLDEAAKDVAIDTAKAAAVGYGTAATGSAIKGVMQQSSNAGLRTLSQTAAPVIALNVCLSLGSSVKRYVNGEISEGQFLSEVGEKGAGMLSSSMMAALGQVAIPIPVVGAVIGSMIGYSLSSFFYQSALEAALDVERSRQDLERIRAIQEVARMRISDEQAVLDELIRTEIPALKQETEVLFSVTRQSLNGGDINAVAEEINSYAKLLGKNMQFKSMEEFEGFMALDESLRL